ncbi:c-type cytochrome [Aestuariirhabdus sp. LZHN29]|uniref:c-type cytochrome n=1 Tax=Aestuariirhabdus sp. LZHN29 TaxID=3417462 RepID=UPI003CF6A6D2
MGSRWVIKISGLGAIAIGLLLAVLPQPRVAIAATAVETTYQKFLQMAELGDPEAQNFVGYMLLYGEGVERNHKGAHDWFHESAEQGYYVAARNLGIFHSGALPGVPEGFIDRKESNLWFSLAAANLSSPEDTVLASRSYSLFLGEQIPPQSPEETDYRFGERVYLGLCAGCHGFNGWAAHEGVPSFARYDRLNRDDYELVQSVLNGKGNMPGWEGIFSVRDSFKVLDYIRQRFILNGGDIPPRPLPTLVDNPQEHQLGEHTFITFCAGCHGFSGIAYYRHSPSFALGERLHKTDGELLGSITDGRGQMPGWGEKLESRQIRAVLRYIRTLKPNFDSGLVNHLREPPEIYFRFRPRGEEGSDENWSWIRR